MIDRKRTPALLVAALLLTALPGAPAAPALAATASAPAATATAPTALSDVAGHWAAADIQAAAAAGWVNGYPDGTFRPEGQVTRAEFLKMLALASEQRTNTILDERQAALYDHLAEQEHWSVERGFIMAALARGVLEPSDYPLTFAADGQVETWSLQPDQPLTRTDAAVMLTRAIGRKYEAEAPWYYPGSRFAWAKSAPTLTAADGAAVPAWAKGWWHQAIDAGLILGYPDNTLRGTKTITRAEAVVLLRRVATAQAQPPGLLSQIQAPQTETVKGMDGLGMMEFVPVGTVRWQAAANMTWEETAKAWTTYSRADKERFASYVMKEFRAEVYSQDWAPLSVHRTMLRIEGRPGQILGELHYDEVSGQAEYLDVNGMATPANPAPDPIVLLPIPGAADLDFQFQQAKERAAASLTQPLEPRQVYTFPYQYLSDWFRLNDAAVRAWAEPKLRAYYAEAKSRVEAVGGTVKAVHLQVAPSDTADRAGQYRSLLIGQTLLESPVYDLAFDGQTVTVVAQPATLDGWADSLDLQYEWEQMGEGWGAPHVDPPAADARRFMHTFVLTLGRRPTNP